MIEHLSVNCLSRIEPAFVVQREGPIKELIDSVGGQTHNSGIASPSEWLRVGRAFTPGLLSPKLRNHPLIRSIEPELWRVKWLRLLTKRCPRKERSVHRLPETNTPRPLRYCCLPKGAAWASETFRIPSCLSATAPPFLAWGVILHSSRGPCLFELSIDCLPSCAGRFRPAAASIRWRNPQCRSSELLSGDPDAQSECAGVRVRRHWASFPALRFADQPQFVTSRSSFIHDNRIDGKLLNTLGGAQHDSNPRQVIRDCGRPRTVCAASAHMIHQHG